MLKKLFFPSKSSKVDEKERAALEREKSNKENKKPVNNNQYLRTACYATNTAPKTRRGPKSDVGRVSSHRNNDHLFGIQDNEFNQQPHKRPRTSDFEVHFDPRQSRGYREDPQQHRSSRSGRAMSSYGSERQSNSSHGYSDSTIDEEESDLDRTIKTRDGRRTEDYELGKTIKKLEYYKQKYVHVKKFGKAKDDRIKELEAENEIKEKKIEELEARLRFYENSNQYGNMHYGHMTYQPFPPSMQMPNFVNGPLSGNSNGGYFTNYHYPRPFGMEQFMTRGFNESSNTPSSGIDPQPTNEGILNRNMFGASKTTDMEEEDEIKEFRTASTSSMMTTNDESSFDSNVSNLLEEETKGLTLNKF